MRGNPHFSSGAGRGRQASTRSENGGLRGPRTGVAFIHSSGWPTGDIAKALAMDGLHLGSAEVTHLPCTAAARRNFGLARAVWGRPRVRDRHGRGVRDGEMPSGHAGQRSASARHEDGHGAGSCGKRTARCGTATGAPVRSISAIGGQRPRRRFPRSGRPARRQDGGSMWPIGEESRGGMASGSYRKRASGPGGVPRKRERDPAPVAAIRKKPPAMVAFFRISVRLPMCACLAVARHQSPSRMPTVRTG